jgi:hypothetical protein
MPGHRQFDCEYMQTERTRKKSNHGDKVYYSRKNDEEVIPPSLAHDSEASMKAEAYCYPTYEL